MAESYRFFATSGTDIREYTQAEFAEVLASIYGNGVLSLDNKLEVIENTPNGMSVLVKTGQAWINGYWYKNDAELELTLSASDATNDRIDLVVLRLDILTDRVIELNILEGTPSVSPVKPTLTQTTQTYEIEIASILVEATETTIANADITDGRVFVDKIGRSSYDLTLAVADWVGASAPYTQALTLTGILASDDNHTHIGVDYSGTLATAILEKTAWNMVSKAVVTDDTITFTCFEDKPVTEINLKVEVLK